MLVHQHAIVDAYVGRRSEEINEASLAEFLNDLVEVIEMKKLFEPIAIHGKFGFTGIVGIVTSHIAFHYFDGDRSLHLDVYSCKPYDLDAVMRFVHGYWSIDRAVIHLIDRIGPVTTRRFRFESSILSAEE